MQFRTLEYQWNSIVQTFLWRLIQFSSVQSKWYVSSYPCQQIFTSDSSNESSWEFGNKRLNNRKKKKEGNDALHGCFADGFQETIWKAVGRIAIDNPKRAETMGKVFQVIFHETSWRKRQARKLCACRTWGPHKFTENCSEYCDRILGSGIRNTHNCALVRGKKSGESESTF